ncbi:MAG: hypothetical protein R8K20_00100 [Gallionellaceae bacterium]
MSNVIAHTSTQKKASKPKVSAHTPKSIKGSTVAALAHKTTVKSEKVVRKSGSVMTLAGQVLSRQQLLLDMESYRRDVVATPTSARAFLTRLGVMTSDGRSKKLIRG